MQVDCNSGGMSNSNRPKCQPAYIRDASWEIRDHLNALERYIDDLEGKLRSMDELNAGLEATVEALNPVMPAGELTVPTPTGAMTVLTDAQTEKLVAHASARHDEVVADALGNPPFSSTTVPDTVLPSPPVIVATGGRPPKTQTPEQAKAVAEHYVLHGTAKSAFLGSAIGVSQAMAFRWLKDLAAETGLEVPASHD